VMGGDYLVNPISKYTKNFFNEISLR